MARGFGGRGRPRRWTGGKRLFTYSLALAGVWTMVIPAIVAARQRGFAFAAKAIALMPFYYILVSAAAWTAIADAILRPHYWAKTAPHGESRREAGASGRRRAASPAGVGD